MLARQPHHPEVPNTIPSQRSDRPPAEPMSDRDARLGTSHDAQATTSAARGAKPYFSSQSTIITYLPGSAPPIPQVAVSSAPSAIAFSLTFAPLSVN